MFTGYKILDIFYHEEKFCCFASFMHTFPYIIKDVFKDTPMFEHLLHNATYAHKCYHDGAALSIAGVSKIRDTLNKSFKERYQVYQLGTVNCVLKKKKNPKRRQVGNRLQQPSKIAWQIQELLRVKHDSAFILQV